MKYFDITREWRSAPVYPGDPPPRLSAIQSMAAGDTFNVNEFAGSLHNGTHLDAPLHAIPNGEDVSELALKQTIGECHVVRYEGVLLGDAAERILPVAPSRLLFKGNVTISRSAAFVLADAGLKVVGVEGPSVSSPEEDVAVHRHLLMSGTLILENLDLSAVDPGVYFLFAAPMKMAGAEAAPVRAVLTDRKFYL